MPYGSSPSFHNIVLAERYCRVHRMCVAFVALLLVAFADVQTKMNRSVNTLVGTTVVRFLGVHFIQS